MDTQVEAQIYLADHRGCSETHVSRSEHTFNFGSYQQESRTSFGSLQLLNEDMLRAGASLTMQVEQDTDAVLLPITGGLEYKSAQATGSLEPGQVGIFSLTAGEEYTVSNPYETESIQFIQLWLTRTVAPLNPAFRQTQFDLTTKNTLLPLFDATDSESIRRPSGRGFIGQYGGRQEDTYRAVDAQTNRIFVFVLQGVFEVANRLLHEKDGLALRHMHDETVEFEALSNDALLLLLEIS